MKNAMMCMALALTAATGLSAGQVLIITSGVGRTQEWGKPVQEVRPGDVVICPVGVKHWHGAAPNSSMSHISICEEKEPGKVVEWMEKVTDEQYNGIQQ